ncbi:protein LNK3 isoform X1 [Syzygium oleosum]|uniref:protein LNK3 isoform X1 n=1 Tax=Syzygium oleosum TaxID=219896 RepID=UPI0011D23729|nr:protein LNK3 isoform X1 [Syzygium oleosum]XP_056168827.1 protein LNK3 isoform X1 [Syzygium oleosum]
MDWYYGNGTNVLVVPKEQEFSDRLPSPNSWHHWGTYSCPTFGSPNKFLVTGDKEIKLNMMSCSEAEMQLSPRNRHHSSASSTCEGLSSGPFHRNVLSVDMPDCQIDLAKADQTDDIFLNSLFVDSPGNETLDRAYCWCPSCNHGMLPADDSCLKVMDSRSISRNSSPSMSFEIDQGVTMPQFDWCNMEDDNFQPTKALAQLVKIPCPSEEYGVCQPMVEETMSTEEYVLWELETVMAQLSEKMRICFRDALYRLADNSKQHPVEAESHSGNSSAERSPLWTLSAKSRRSRNFAKESETNVIDRAIANIMFNKMDFNLQDSTAIGADSFKHDIIGACDPYTPRWSDDFEVPVFGKK